MNNLLDLVNKWANRLTIRILMIGGVSQETINRVVEGMNERQTIVSQSDKKLRSKFTWVKWVIITVIIGAVTYITLNIKKLIKK